MSHDAHLHDLIQRHVDGLLTSAEASELDTLVAASPEASRQLADAFRLDVAIARVARAISTPTTVIATSRTPMPPLRGSAQRTRRLYRLTPIVCALAATLLLGGAAVTVYRLAFSGDPQTEIPNPQSNTPVATLIDAEGTVIVNDDVAYPGADYQPGTYSIASGTAEYLLTNGVSVSALGPAEIEMHSNMLATVRRGLVSFECPPGVTGFTVLLPHGVRVVDLGTAFSVNAGPTGSSTIEVASGSVRVDWTERGAAQSQTLRVGEATRIGYHDDLGLTARRLEAADGREIRGVAATATSELHDEAEFVRLARHLVDGSGLDPTTGAHVGTPDGTMWESIGVRIGRGDNIDRRPAVTFDLGGMYRLKTMRVWNYNEGVGGLTRRGIADARILVSVDGSDFVPLGGSNGGDGRFTLRQADGRADTNDSQRIPLWLDKPVRFVRIEAITTHAGTDFDAGVIHDEGFAGLAEVKIFGEPVDAPAIETPDAAPPPDPIIEFKR